MKVFHTDRHAAHHPKHFLVSGALQSSPEVPARAERLVASAVKAGLELTEPADFGLGPIASIHTPEYVRFLATIHERWMRIGGGSEEVIPNIHPDRRNGSYPASAVGQAGYHQADTACPIGAGTWEAVRGAADCAADAALAVLGGDSSAYALCRPPGHHAFADMAGGFCFVNNSGIAAQLLREHHDRVAILDVDLHHGNGTQGVFYNRADVLTVSLHADPVRFYPFFWGYADERGEGAGLGYNYNLPMPRGTADAAYMPYLDQALERIEHFAPGALVIALGLDGFEGDPFGGLSISTKGFGQIAERVAKLGLPTVLVQEGGYLCDELGDNLEHFLGPFV